MNSSKSEPKHIYEIEAQIIKAKTMQEPKDRCHSVRSFKSEKATSRGRAIPFMLLMALHTGGYGESTLSAVKINRTLPAVSSPPAYPRFSGQPLEHEITQAYVFGEPLLALAKTSPSENAHLAGAITGFLRRSVTDDASLFAAFMIKYPQSSWNASLSANLGDFYYRNGLFSKALDAWEKAWLLSRNIQSRNGRDVSDMAVSQLAKMNARLGRADKLEAIFSELGNTEITGSSRDRIVGAKTGLWMMRNKPEEAFRCGPMALATLMTASNRTDDGWGRKILDSKSTLLGISLSGVRDLSRDLGLNLRMAKRTAAAPIPLPAVVHWKVDHYAAITEYASGRYRVVDPTFGDDFWLTESALQSEASGYFLIPSGTLPSGWADVPEEEGKTVFGKGVTQGSDPDNTRPNDTRASSGPNPDCHGMPTYSFHAMLCNLNINDIPLGYAPPKGPKVEFKLTYNHREANQPATFSHANVGKKWTFNWFSYLIDDPTSPSSNLKLYVEGGGAETYYNYNSTTLSFAPHFENQSVLKRISTNPIKYLRKMADGAIEFYEISNGAATYPRKVYLTKIQDPAGNALTFTYDSALRLVAVQDALGQVTTVSYHVLGDSLKISGVTDPFGRSISLVYNGSGQLSSITDVIGLQSQFGYGASDFIQSMTTPYGTTTYRFWESGYSRALQATDPLGLSERVEFKQNAAGITDADPTGAPAELAAMNYHLFDPTSFYWDKNGMKANPGVYTKAKIYNWMKSININMAGSMLKAEKRPLENRVWYTYPSQSTANYSMNWNMPGQRSRIGRLMDDGTEQFHRYEYNSIGNATKYTDPLGRITTIKYDTNLIDIVSVRQERGTTSNLIDSLVYNGQHLPIRHKDASGMVSTSSYNASGQVVLTVNPKGDSVTYTYNSSGYLIRMQGPVPGDTTVFEYDSFGRVAAKTDLDGYTVRSEYDAFDRLTKVHFPDSTYQEYVYDRLDLTGARDRRGRWTKTLYNANRQVVAVQDALGRTTNLDWCACGSLKSLTDPKGNKTVWQRDLQGRVTAKKYPDGRSESFAYENTTSRLMSKTDAKGQVTHYKYFLDDHPKETSYTNTPVSTPTVSYTYDTLFNRILSMTDGIGLTTYGYKPITVPPALGSGSLSVIDGPWSNDSVKFLYDSLGRIESQSIQGANSAWSFDKSGRITGETNSLGHFSFYYSGLSDRMDSLLYPGGMRSSFTYYPKAADLRLEKIVNRKSGGDTLSVFQYTYDAEGQIQTWSQRMGASEGKVHTLAYDNADQLIGDVVRSSAPGTPVVANHAYAYDKSGNRISRQKDSTVESYAGNGLNQLISVQPGGLVRIKGQLNEPATTTVNGAPVPVSSGNAFEGYIPLAPGEDSATLTATDYSHNATTRKYVLRSNGVADAMAYDYNGNMTAQGNRTFEWDAENRLTAISWGSRRSEFTYDGLDRRVKRVEKEGASILSQATFLWVGNVMREERDFTGSTVAKRFFDYGIQNGSAKYFYTKDHLGSIREMTDSNGVIAARYEYDPFGERFKVEGSQDADFGFTGFYLHQPTGLSLTKYRAYNSSFGRWISRDPIEERGGLNLYGYVDNRPINQVDPFGLEPTPGTDPANPGQGPVRPGPNGPQPKGLPGDDWKWYPDKSNGRNGGQWKQPGKSGEGASWDESPSGGKGAPHWDWDQQDPSKPGKTKRGRRDENGQPVSEDDAHPRGRPKGWNIPPPDPGTSAAATAIAGFWIFMECGGWVFFAL
jgi:RHS repeat-associated protein